VTNKLQKGGSQELLTIFQKVSSSILLLSGGGGNGNSDVVERTVGVVGMVVCLTIIVKLFGDNGIIALILAAQFAMYQETMTVVKSYHEHLPIPPPPPSHDPSTHTDIVTESDSIPLSFTIPVHVPAPVPVPMPVGKMAMNATPPWQPWLWFLTAQAGTSMSVLVTRAMLPSWMTVSKSFLDLITLSLGGLSLMSMVIGMAVHSTTGPAAFRLYLGSVAMSVLALLFTVALPSFLIRTVIDFGLPWILFSVLLVVTNDTMAYVFGRLFGNTKLLPKLSPKKTVEGFVGAGLSTVAISIPLLRLLLPKTTGSTHNTARHAMAMAIYASIVAPFGGFLASAVKRAHYVKDFGALIPGHGGVVDRLDCQIVMAPFVFLFLTHCLK